MNILQLSYFLSVAQTQSFRETAEHFYVTQPAVSIQISGLEEEWGFKLFYRKYRSVELTPAGENMYRILSGHHKEFELALRQSREIPEDPLFHIYIGIPEWFDTGSMGEILSRFMKEHPKVDVHVSVITKEQNNFSRNGKGQFDILISLDAPLIEHEDIVHLPFSNSHYGFFIHEKHPLCRKDSKIQMSDLNGETVYLITETFDDDSILYYDRFCASLGLRNVHFRLYANAFSAIFEARMRGGIILLENSPMTRNNARDFSIVETDIPCHWIIRYRKAQIKPWAEELAQVLSKENKFDS